MEKQLMELIEALQQHAKTCETVAQDKTEQALTGESSEKEKNTQDANEWMIRSKVWLEAEAVAREFAQPTTNLPPASILPLDSPAPDVSSEPARSFRPEGSPGIPLDAAR